MNTATRIDPHAGQPDATLFINDRQVCAGDKLSIRILFRNLTGLNREPSSADSAADSSPMTENPSYMAYMADFFGAPLAKGDDVRLMAGKCRLGMPELPCEQG